MVGQTSAVQLPVAQWSKSIISKHWPRWFSNHPDSTPQIHSLSLPQNPICCEISCCLSFSKTAPPHGEGRTASAAHPMMLYWSQFHPILPLTLSIPMAASFFFFFFFSGYDSNMCVNSFPGQGLRQHHSSGPNHSSDDTRSLTHWATRELLPMVSWFWHISPHASKLHKSKRTKIVVVAVIIVAVVFQRATFFKELKMKGFFRKKKKKTEWS